MATPQFDRASKETRGKVVEPKPADAKGGAPWQSS
jgi:hypothetical protein